MASLVGLCHLMRLNKPIGILLLLWPTLWALWLAAGGFPGVTLFFIFTLGVVLMRSAGCVVNDIADRNVDGHVARTKSRPLAMRTVSVKAALMTAFVLTLAAFLLVLMCNVFTVKLAFVGAALAFIYPFLKRITHWPQLGLGLAFGWGVVMGFAAVTNHIPSLALWLYAASIVWPLMYDTEYAMVDRADDIKIGVKSTAVLFGRRDCFMIGTLQLLFLWLMVIVGVKATLSFPYYASLFIAGIFFLYQQWLIKQRDPAQCFKAFLNNHWVGLVIFIGIVAALGV
ncbi:MAG TPA: 4-hydroxybenzoate octaprenyltransferase [Gammaproteobacteria bacterium]|nr:4-hydroxybenzoate octaprenyltransferase [Gammaproteobacteria bacterium]